MTLYSELSDWAKRVELHLYSEFVPELTRLLYGDDAMPNGAGLCDIMTGLGCIAIGERFKVPTFHAIGYYLMIEKPRKTRINHVWIRARNHESVSVDLTSAQTGSGEYILVVPESCESEYGLRPNMEVPSKIAFNAVGDMSKEMDSFISGFFDAVRWPWSPAYQISKSNVNGQLKYIYKHFLEA